MKVKNSRLKQIISMVSGKYSAVRSKTDAIRARLMLTSLTLLSKKESFTIAAISAKINNIFHHHAEDADADDADDMSKAIVLYSSSRHATIGGGSDESTMIGSVREFEDDDDKYPDLRHSLFEEEEEQELADLLDDPSSSISAIDMVKNSKESGENFNLEENINQVADLFITKFHKRMRLQKLLSFKRQQQQQMLEN